jgi:dihydroorotase
MSSTISVPSPFDAHVHLREGPVSELVTPHVKLGGIDVAYVMVGSFSVFSTPLHLSSYLIMNPRKAASELTYLLFLPSSPT